MGAVITINELAHLLPVVSPPAFKVYVAMAVMKERHGAEPFPATLQSLISVAALSQPTVTKSRQELVKLGLVKEAGAGYYWLGILAANGMLGSTGSERTSRESGLSSRKETSSSKKAKAIVFDNRAAKGVGTLDQITEWREVLREAFRLLGQPERPRLVTQAMQKLHAHVREGTTAEELLEVVRWEAAEWRRGDRWKVRHNLMYLWSVKNFTSLLGMARSKTGSQGPEQSVEWHAAADVRTQEIVREAEAQEFDPVFQAQFIAKLKEEGHL